MKDEHANGPIDLVRNALARLAESAERWAEGDSNREAVRVVREDAIDVGKLIDAFDVLSDASASICYGLVNGPITLYACGEISGGRMRECIGEWVAGKRSWQLADFGMTDWPAEVDVDPQTLRKQRDEAREARDRWAHQCNLASEAQADALNRLAIERGVSTKLTSVVRDLRGEVSRMAADGGGFSCEAIDDADEALNTYEATR